MFFYPFEFVECRVDRLIYSYSAKHILKRNGVRVKKLNKAIQPHTFASLTKKYTKTAHPNSSSVDHSYQPLTCLFAGQNNRLRLHWLSRLGGCDSGNRRLSPDGSRSIAAWELYGNDWATTLLGCDNMEFWRETNETQNRAFCY